MRRCRYCQAEITVNRHPAGNWIPTNQDGSIHRCRKPKKNKPDHKASKTITGASYTPANCECKVPPWEHCPCPASGRPCKLCGSPVLVRIVGGKVCQVDPADGKRHWFTCLMTRRAEA